MAEAESWRGMLPLELVFVTLDNNQAVPEDNAQELTNERWLLIVISLVDQDF